MTRDPVFDIAKGLGVVLVLLGHLSLPFWAINVIYFFHMPLFIFITGFFHKQKPVMDVFKSTGRLLLSYYFYGIVFILISLMITGNFDKTSFCSFLAARPVGIWVIPYFGVFWFIIALAVIKILAQWVPLNRITLLISLIAFVAIYYLNREIIDITNLPLALGQVFLLFPFYIAGNLFKPYLTKALKFKDVIISLYLILTSLSIVFWGGFTSKIVNYHQLSLFNPLIALALAALGTIAIIIVSGWLVRYCRKFSKLIEDIGRNSFFYFAIHLFCFGVIAYGLTFLEIRNPASRNTLMLLLTLIICRVMVFLLLKVGKKYPSVSTILLLK